MGVIRNEPPEKKLARRLFKRQKLTIPFDLDALARKYAEVIYTHIPIDGVDGVSLNLKVPGKTPTIIVNSINPAGRQRFTLAHELGHVIIPWHLGTIIDDVHSQNYKDFLYGMQEQEANSFAAELLMPESWISDVYSAQKYDLALTHSYIASTAKVSDHAAAIAMIGNLPSNIVYAAVDGGEVIHSGKTARTSAFPPEPGADILQDYYPYQKHYSIFHGTSFDYCWWNLNVGIETNVDDERHWKDILDEIIADIKPSQGSIAFKMSLSGIIGSAKSMLQEEVKLDALTAAILYRLRRSDLKEFTSHRDFETFVKKRAQEIYNRSNP